MSKIEKALRKARDSTGTSGRSLVRANRASKATDPPAASSDLVVGAAESTAMIAFMSQPTALDVAGRQQRKLIVPEAVETATIKALREIRTKILQQASSGNCVIMVTGTSLGSGTSFLSANLGAAFALDAARTALVIDCNIRDPNLHHLVAGDIKAGLTNYLTDTGNDIADIIMPTGIPRMRVIPAGVNVDPAVEYFTMSRMRRLIRSVSERYPDRTIILDCPPIARSADSQILLDLCDYAIVVVPYAGATPARLQAALKLIDSRKLLGVVLNQEPNLPPIDLKSATTRFLTTVTNRTVQSFRAWTERLGKAVRRTG